MRRKQKGFTLVELIIVIALIGILAAVAVPRFMNQTKNARVAALNGLAGAIQSADNLAQAQYVAEGNSFNSTATTISMNSATPNVTVVAGTGRPAAEAGGIDVALSSYNGFDVAFDAGVATFTFETSMFAQTLTNCEVQYDQSTGATTVVTTGC